MKMSLMVALVACLLVTSALSCGDSEAERERNALDVAQTWTEDSTETVVSEVVSLVISGIPGSSLFDTFISNQVADLLSWSFTKPANTTGSIYAVTATVSTQVSLDLPLLGMKAYEARLPFDLLVDIETSSVTSWSANLGSASVGEASPSQ